MKKVCFLQMGRGPGGVTKVTEKLSQELLIKYDVYLVTLRNLSQEKIWPISEHIHQKIINSDGLNPKKHFLKTIFRLRRYLKQNQIDILIIQDSPPSIFAFIATLFLKTKVIFSDHWNFTYASKFGLFGRWLASKLANKIVVLTDETKSDYQKKLKTPSEKIRVIYNWIDSIELKSEKNEEQKRIITVGRINKIKGIDLLLPVAKEVLDKHLDWTWHIFGASQDNDLKENIEEFIASHGLKNRLVLEGVSLNLSEEYQKSDIFVFTSRAEGLPLVLLEAKQYSLPIVSYSCPTGPSEIIRHGENGFLIEPLNQNEMIQSINDLIENKEKRLLFSKKASLDIDKFKKDKILGQWFDLLEELIDQ